MPKRCLAGIAGLLVVFVAIAARGGQPEAIPIEKEIVYGKAGGVDLHLDLARPPAGDGPFPLVICIHGGAWRGGNKTSYHALLRGLATNGYVGATAQYRFCPKDKFPAQIEDVKCAVRFLRAHAKDYKLDPAKVAVLGDSAGGHLALLAGLMDPADGLEGTGGCADQPSKVQAVVNYYGPTDFSMPLTPNPVVIGWLEDFFGTKDQKDPIVAKASPVTYVNKGDPPVLTFHGTVDPLVSLDHAKRLHEALKKAGVPEHLEIIQGGGHGFSGPNLERTLKMTTEFLEHCLKGKPEPAWLKAAAEKN